MSASPLLTVLGIETTCDDTAVALIQGRVGEKAHILGEAAHSQIDLHRVYGGVVPEIAARSHLSQLQPLIDYVFRTAQVSPQSLDGIAGVAGPGLIGGVIVGLQAAKGIALALQKPFIAVNHLEGHALTVRATDAIAFPYVLLLVSGGHCQILIVRGVGQYERLGTTIDDAVGEAFDKVSKMLGLGYPGGPIVEKQALIGDKTRFSFPRPLKNVEGFDFSFSGLKTAVLRTFEKIDPVTPQDIADICACFQDAVTDCLTDKVSHALAESRRRLGFSHKEPLAFVMAGGVAANQAIRTALEKVCARHHSHLVAPPVRLCTDNGVMIAWAGLERLALGLTDPLNTAPRARWPLTELSPVALEGL